jgi:chorismate mutase
VTRPDDGSKGDAGNGHAGNGHAGNGHAGGGARPSALDREEAALELARVRDRIDELDKRIVKLLNERAILGRTAGRAKQLAGRRAIKDPEREREVLLRVAMANPGPLSQADLLSIYRRIVSATRGLESRDRGHDGRTRD